MKEQEFYLKIYDNVVELELKDGILDNSLYEITIEGLQSMDKKKKLEDTTFKVWTAMKPSLCPLEAVRSLVSSFNLTDEEILYKIKEASELAEYIGEKKYQEDNVPYYVREYVKYKAAHDSLLKYSIERTTQMGYSGAMGEVQFKVENTSAALTTLLSTLKIQVKEWELDVVSGGRRRGVLPKSAVRSKQSTYATNISGYGRGVT